MNFISKVAITSVALASMIQADTMLFGIDAGITIGGARLGLAAGITGGSARNYTAPGYAAYSSCGSAVSVPVYETRYQPVYVPRPMPVLYVDAPTVVVSNPCATAHVACEVMVPVTTCVTYCN
jgi:hypothetical protein